MNDFTDSVGTKPLAYVYLPAHGYPDGQESAYRRREPTAYNRHQEHQGLH
jgi:hypothetical protein